MIQPIGSIYTDSFYPNRNFYQFRRDSPADNPLSQTTFRVTDIVDLSPEAQAILTAQEATSKGG